VAPGFLKAVTDYFTEEEPTNRDAIRMKDRA
jgi:hypothetical protein